jgi:hypothetical protein
MRGGRWNDRGKGHCECGVSGVGGGTVTVVHDDSLKDKV